MTNEEVLQLIQQAVQERATVFDIGGNELTEIPSEIGLLTNLKELNLRENKLTYLPVEIGNLTGLKKLYLSGNKLTSLPSEIGQLKELERIYLSGNKLTELPAEIGQLTKLNYIYLRDNDLTSLPIEINLLTNLKFLDVRKTKLPVEPDILENTHKPDLIIEKCLQAILGEGSEPTTLQQAKIVILGAPGVGKTYILRCLKQDDFNSDSENSSGINVEAWSATINDQEIELNLWDFGAEAIFLGLDQLFLTPGSIFLVVIDAGKNELDNQLEYWLKLINSLAPASPIIVVANKIDKSFMNLNRRRLANNFSNIAAIVETSCVKNEGFESLKTFITKEIQSIPHLKSDLPVSWIQVPKHLEQNQQKYLSESDYSLLCQQQQIFETKDQKSLLNLMKMSGKYVEINEHIAEAKWLALELSKALTIGLEESDQETTSFLQGVIQKLELGYDSPYEHKFVMPSLVREKNITLEDWEHSLKFRYKYNISPVSLICRLTVRLNPYIHQYTYSRDKVIFATEGSMALLKADANNIVILVKGDEQTSQNFLSYIRNELQALHQTNPGLKATEYEEISPLTTSLTEEVEVKEAPPREIIVSMGSIDHTSETEPLLDNPQPEEVIDVEDSIKSNNYDKTLLSQTQTSQDSDISTGLVISLKTDPKTLTRTPAKSSQKKTLSLVALGVAMALVTVIAFTLKLGFIPIIIAAVVLALLLFWIFRGN